MSDSLLTPRRLLAAVVIGGLLAVALRPVFLEKLGVAFHGQWFLDSYAILAAGDAVRAGIDVSAGNPLDALNRPHVYSDWWLGLHWLGLSRNDNFIFGSLCGLAFLGVALAGVRPRSHGETVALAPVLLSPPCLIALHRANNDLVIFALLGAGLLALRGTASAPRLAVFGLTVVVATGLKYYPLVAAAAPVAVLPWRRTTVLAAGATLGLAGVVLVGEWSSVGRGLFELPQTIYQFGAPVLWRDLEAGRAAMAGIAAAIIGAGALVAARRRWTAGLADETAGSEGERLMFAVGALVLLGCFLAGTSYIYRWIFGLWMWPWLWRNAAAGPSRAAARMALVTWGISIWADGVCCLAVNSFDLSYRPGAAWRWATQSVNWLLMVLLAGWIMEALLAQSKRRTRSRGLAASGGISSPG